MPTFEEAFALSNTICTSVTEAALILLNLREAGLEIRPRADQF
jgi:hypothetical protein